MAMGKVKVERRDRLHRVCKSIIDGGPRIVDDEVKAAFKSAVLRYAGTEYLPTEQAVKNIYQSEDLVADAFDVIAAATTRKQRDDQNFRSVATGAIYPRSSRSFVDVLDEIDEDEENDRERNDEDDETGIAKASRNHRAGHHGLAAAVVEHALDRLDSLRERHGYQKSAKEQPMTSHTEFVRDVVKQYGITALCKSMVQDQKSYGLDESSFTALVVDFAKRDAPAGETEAQSFTRLFTAPTEEGVLLRKAHALAKETTWLDLQPMVISGGDMRDDDDREQALKQLAEIGRRMAPTATPEKQFDLAFSDPKNAALASRAHVRPSAPAGGAYAWPR
jgi:hypothetical protein